MSEWISVRERLPECTIRPECFEYVPYNLFRNSVRVLVSYLCDGEVAISTAERYIGNRGVGDFYPEGWSIDFDLEGEDNSPNVTHWMPLPEPPK